MRKIFALSILIIASMNCQSFADVSKEFVGDIQHIQRLLDELDYMEALESANAAIKIHGEDRPVFHYLKGRALQQLDRNEKAVSEFTKAIDLAIAQRTMQAKMVEALRSRALCNLKLNKPEESIKDLNRAFQLNPHLGLTVLELAMANKQANHYQAVVDNINDALKIKMDLAMTFRAYNARAWAYDHLDKPELGEADRQKIKALQKKFVE